MALVDIIISFRLMSNLFIHVLQLYHKFQRNMRRNIIPILMQLQHVAVGLKKNLQLCRTVDSRFQKT